MKTSTEKRLLYLYYSWRVAFPGLGLVDHSYSSDLQTSSVREKTDMLNCTLLKHAFEIGAFKDLLANCQGFDSFLLML